MHITEWKKPTYKGYIIYKSNYMTFWKRQNYGEGEKISIIQGLCGRQEWIGSSQSLLGPKIILHDTTMVDTYNLHLSKYIECKTSRVNSNENCSQIDLQGKMAEKDDP